MSIASGVSAQEDASLLPRPELFVLPLAAALGLLLLFLAVAPIHRLAGSAGGVVLRRREIAVVIVVVLNSLAIGILIAQLGR